MHYYMLQQPLVMVVALLQELVVALLQELVVVMEVAFFRVVVMEVAFFRVVVALAMLAAVLLLTAMLLLTVATAAAVAIKETLHGIPKRHGAAAKVALNLVRGVFAALGSHKDRMYANANMRRVFAWGYLGWA
jgi:hypothetical protein